MGFRDHGKELTSLGVSVLGVSPDGEESHRAFRAKYDLTMPLLCDPEKKVMERYGAFGEKMMYGKKRVGVIRSTVWIGPDRKVVRHWRKVPNAAKHPEKVLEALRDGL